MKISVSGLKEFNDVCNKIPTEAIGAARRSLKRSLLDLQRKSVERAPKDKGTLRGSCRTETTETSSSVSGMIGYFVPYATRQHEGLNYRHIQGEAKFLENPFKENVDLYVEAMAKAIKEAIDK